MGLINEYLRPLLQKLSLRKRVEAIADSPIAAKNGADFKGNTDHHQPDLAPKVSESKQSPPNKVRVTSENGGLKKLASKNKKKGKKVGAASIMQESRTRIAATPNARTSSGNSLACLISFGHNQGSNRADGSGTDEVDDGALWRKKILMGKRCKPLELDERGKNSESEAEAEAEASEVVSGVNKGPALTVAEEERNQIVVSLERKCLDEDYHPFPSRKELDTDPFVLGWLYVAEICSDYNTTATSSSDSSTAGSATGGGNSMRSLARCDSGKVLWSTQRRRSMSVMSRYLGKVKKTLMRKRRRRKAKGSATPLFTPEAWRSDAVLYDGWVVNC